MKKSLLTVLAGLLALSAGGCMGEQRRPGDRPSRALLGAAAATAERPAVDEGELRRFGFILYWDSFIRDETLTALTLEGDFEQGFGRPQLYAYTQSNRLYQVDMHSGMVNWLVDIGEPLSFSDKRWIAEWVYKPEEPQGEGGQRFKRYDEVFLIARDRLFAIDKENGAELWQVRLPFGASSPPQASETHVFVGSWDDRIYAFRKSDPTIPDWNWRTDGDILARPAFDSPSLFVASSDGNLHTFDATSGVPRWKFDAEKRLLLDPLVFKKLLYVPGEDYNLYVLNVLDGLLEYRYCAEAPILGRPVAVDNGDDQTIYFLAQGRGMFALARKHRPRGSRKTEHALLWNRPQARQFLCRGASDVYVLEDGDELGEVKIVRLGARDGKVKDTLELKGVDWVLTNPSGPGSAIREESLLGGIIIVGYRNGWVMAFKEIATLPGGVEAN